MTPVRSFPAVQWKRPPRGGGNGFHHLFHPFPRLHHVKVEYCHIVLRIRQAASCQWEGMVVKPFSPRKSAGFAGNLLCAAQVDDGGNPPLPELFQLPFL